MTEETGALNAYYIMNYSNRLCIVNILYYSSVTSLYVHKCITIGLLPHPFDVKSFNWKQCQVLEIKRWNKIHFKQENTVYRYENSVLLFFYSH